MGDRKHRGHALIRKAIDSFRIPSARGEHLCLVYEPLRETVDHYRWRFADGQPPLSLIRAYAQILLVGLDYLHTTCRIVHTGMPDQVYRIILRHNANGDRSEAR